MESYTGISRVWHVIASYPTLQLLYWRHRMWSAFSYWISAFYHPVSRRNPSDRDRISGLGWCSLVSRTAFVVTDTRRTRTNGNRMDYSPTPWNPVRSGSERLRSGAYVRQHFSPIGRGRVSLDSQCWICVHLLSGTKLLAWRYYALFQFSLLLDSQWWFPPPAQVEAWRHRPASVKQMLNNHIETEGDFIKWE